MISLTKEQMREYVEGLLPFATIIEAKKVGNTHAVQGIEGEEVITYSVDSEGNEIVERVQNVTLDAETGQPGWILTKVDEENKPVVDKNGHLNQYIVADSVFRKTYEPSTDGPDLYSKSQIEMFIQTDEDIEFDTKYGRMTVSKGGCIKVTDMNRISGISQRDFLDTYVVVERPIKESEESSHTK